MKNEFEEILKERGEELELDKDYQISITHISRIIKDYEEKIDGIDDYVGLGEIGVIRHSILPKLRKELEKNENEYYIIRWD